ATLQLHYWHLQNPQSRKLIKPELGMHVQGTTLPACMCRCPRALGFWTMTFSHLVPARSAPKGMQTIDFPQQKLPSPVITELVICDNLRLQRRKQHHQRR